MINHFRFGLRGRGCQTRPIINWRLYNSRNTGQGLVKKAKTMFMKHPTYSCVSLSTPICLLLLFAVAVAVVAQSRSEANRWWSFGMYGFITPVKNHRGNKLIQSLTQWVVRCIYSCQITFDMACGAEDAKPVVIRNKFHTPFVIVVAAVAVACCCCLGFYSWCITFNMSGRVCQTSRREKLILKCSCYCIMLFSCCYHSWNCRQSDKVVYWCRINISRMSSLHCGHCPYRCFYSWLINFEMAFRAREPNLSRALLEVLFAPMCGGGCGDGGVLCIMYYILNTRCQLYRSRWRAPLDRASLSFSSTNLCCQRWYQ